MIDESTDVSITQILVVYIWLCMGEDVITRFFELSKLSGGRTQHIFDTLLEIIETHNLPVNKLFGMATDGASVMVGEHFGVTRRMKNKNPFILSTHCIAHCLLLASGQAGS